MKAELNSKTNQEPWGENASGCDDFVEVRYRNIRLMYHLKNRLMDLEKFLRTIRGIMETLKTRLDICIDRIEIEIFQDREEWIEHHTVINQQDVPSWVQGDSGRVIRLIMDDEKISTFETLQVMASHECVHHALKKATGGNIPAWIDEGLAVYLSQDLPAEYNEALKRAVLKRATLPLELLDARFSRLDRAIKTLAYAQSRSMVAHLISKYGWDMIKELLTNYKTDGSPDGALRKRGLNMYLLEKEWERMIG